MTRNPDTLEQLYTAHADAVFAFVLNLTRDMADTEDVLQEVFRRLVTSGGPPLELRSERSYLLKLAHRVVMDVARTRTRRDRRHESLAAETTELFAVSPDPDEAAFRQALGGAMAQLPEEQRSVVHLKLWEGLTFEAIGELLEISSNTAASRFRYAVEKLRESLRPIYEEI